LDYFNSYIRYIDHITNIMQIYKTINLINNKFYIGQDSKDNPSYLGSGVRIKYAIRKYGRDNFKKEIIESNIDNLETLNERELYWINLYWETSSNMMYNIAKHRFGGTSMKFRTEEHYQKIVETRRKNGTYIGAPGKRSQETKDKISIGNKGKKRSEEDNEKNRIGHLGKKHTEETKKIIGDIHKGNSYCKGKTVPLEIRNKISEGLKGRPVSKKTRDKLAKTNTGKIMSEEGRKKISEAGKGRKYTEETKKLWSEQRKGRKQSEEWKNKIANSNKGQKRSEESKQKMRDSRKRYIENKKTS